MTDNLKIALVVSFPIAVLVLGCLLAHWVYGDWTCAFAECRKLR